MTKLCIAPIRCILGFLLVIFAVSTVRAGSLEFRSDGFFASPDARVKFFREPWFHCPHLDVDGTQAVTIVGPILNPGYSELSGDATKIQSDAARRQLIETGVLGKFSAPCQRSVTEYKGGLLMRMEYGQVPPEITDAVCRIILPITVFKNRRARWDARDIILPEAKPADGHLVFLDSPNGKANCFRFALANGQELGVKFLSPTKDRALEDCRQWNEMNYHLRAGFEGKKMALFLCLLAPDQPFPDVELPPEQAQSPQAKATDDGAIFHAREGLYEIAVTKTAHVRIRKSGNPLFDIDPPALKGNAAVEALAEPVSFEVKKDTVEIVTKAKDKPLGLRQTFKMDGDGWLSVSASFDGMPATSVQDIAVELTLPASGFAGKFVRAGDRFVELPKSQSQQVSLLDDWEGRILDYELFPDRPEHVTLICDQKAKSKLDDHRQWGQDCFKVGLTPRDGAVKYRLHFWKDDSPPPAPIKGNLLRDGASFETGPDGVAPFACYSWTEKMVEAGTTPVFDTTTAVHGKTSLRLTAEDSVKKGNPRGFAFVGAVFNRVRLKRDRRYTVSAWMKTDKPGLKAVMYCGENTWGGNNWDAFPVTTEWQRYHFTFFTNDFKKSGYFLTWTGIDPACKEGSLWVDAVQLEEGDLSDFQPAAQVEYGVEVAKPDKLFENTGPSTAIVHVRNNGAMPLAAEMKYVIKDYWDQEAHGGSVPVSVPAGSTAAYTVDLGKLPCGYYRGYFTPPGGDVKEIIFGVYLPLPLTPLPDDWPLACHNDPSPLVRELGFGSVRAFEIFEMAGIAPEKAKFDFTRADRMVNEAKRCGLTVMPVLGAFEWPSYRPEPPVPAYAQEKIGPGDIRDARRMAWPTIEAWKDYVRELTRHYKGKVTYWEVMNEPNLLMSPAEYVPYLQAAYVAAKEGNPDCKVVGVCATSDFSGTPSAFIDSVLKLGAAKYFDLLSVHLYDTHPPERTLDAGSDKLIEQWRANLKETYAKDAVIWHSERSYIARQPAYSQRKVTVPLDYCEEPQFLVDTFKHKAEYLIRETLLDSVAGHGGRFFWFGIFDYQSCFISSRYFAPYGLDHAEFDQSPCPELLAANGLARALDGMSHPDRQLAMEDGTRGVVFTGEKGTVAALWNSDGKSRITLGIGSRKSALLNFFGELVQVRPDDQGQITVELEGAPKYLSMPGTDAQSACEMLKQGKLTRAQ